MIRKWLKRDEKKPAEYTLFRLIDVSERAAPDQEILKFLGGEMIQQYRRFSFLKLHYEKEPETKLRDYIKKEVLASASHQLTKNIRQGDFGEILAHLIVTRFEELHVPLRKHLWKFNNDKSIFSTDMVAHNRDGAIQDLYYYEIKSRVDIQKEQEKKARKGKNPAPPVNNYISIIAHNSLSKDFRTPKESIADFLARLSEAEGKFEESVKYFDIVKNPGKYRRYFELFFIIEKNKFQKVILDELEALPPSLSPMKVTVVLIENLKQLIETVHQMAEDAAVEHVYQKAMA